MYLSVSKRLDSFQYKLILLLIQKIFLLKNNTKKILYNSINILFCIFIILSLLIISPLCWSTVWSLQMRKKIGGVFVFHQKILLLKKLKTTSLLNHLNLYIISYKHNIQSYTVIKTKIIRWQNLFLSLDDNSNGRSFLPTNSWRALKQRLLRTPELALVSMARTRCSNNQVPVLRLSTNPGLISKFSQIASCIKPIYCRLSLKTLSLQFSLFAQWIPWSAFHLNDSSPGKYLSSLSSLHWVLLKACLGLFWVSCHLLSHLLWFHFLGGSWPQM